MNEQNLYVVHSVSTNQMKLKPTDLDVGRIEMWDVCRTREEAERVKRENERLGYEANIE